jgi:hypothetical protein
MPKLALLCCAVLPRAVVGRYDGQQPAAGAPPPLSAVFLTRASRVGTPRVCSARVRAVPCVHYNLWAASSHPVRRKPAVCARAAGLRGCAAQGRPRAGAAREPCAAAAAAGWGRFPHSSVPTRLPGGAQRRRRTPSRRASHRTGTHVVSGRPRATRVGRQRVAARRQRRRWRHWRRKRAGASRDARRGASVGRAGGGDGGRGGRERAARRRRRRARLRVSRPCRRGRCRRRGARPAAAAAQLRARGAALPGERPPAGMRQARRRCNACGAPSCFCVARAIDIGTALALRCLRCLRAHARRPQVHAAAITRGGGRRVQLLRRRGQAGCCGFHGTRWPAACAAATALCLTRAAASMPAARAEFELCGDPGKARAAAVRCAPPPPPVNAR